ncbi:hypothetical protein FRUB_06690 [Fimbriiglobus ruber]|uniref:Uncharacterized protein n=1 Tax=Fimbriiglobus ruber TaxID=1908690 RepID=A0A225D7J3_9BACT|nr:hypothetical protein FRUB_06690 [Fimbriiglobus ruber]
MWDGKRVTAMTDHPLFHQVVDRVVWKSTAFHEISGTFRSPEKS